MVKSCLFTPLKYTLLIALLMNISACGDESSHFDIANQGLFTAALSTDSRYAIAASIQHGGSFWDLSQKKRLYNWNHSADEYSSITAAAIAPGGLLSVTADQQQTLVLWNNRTGAYLRFWKAPAEVNSIGLDQHATVALLALKNNQLVLFDVQNGGILRTMLHKDNVNRAAITPDKKYGISGSDDYTAKFWNLDSGKLINSWDLGNRVTTVAITNDGQLVFMALQSGHGFIFNANEKEPLAKIGQSRGSFSQAIFSHDNSQLLTGSSRGEVQLWDTKQGKELSSWQLSRKDIWKPTGISVLALSSNRKGRYQVVGSNGRVYELMR